MSVPKITPDKIMVHTKKHLLQVYKQYFNFLYSSDFLPLVYKAWVDEKHEQCRIWACGIKKDGV